MRTIVIVEGASDKAAVETLARCLGRDLLAERVVVEAIGGAHALRGYLRRLDHGAPARLAGLVDLAEARSFARALETDAAALEERGFFVCSTDLEDELIRALGADAVEGVIREMGELTSFRSFQKQPFHRGEPLVAQLHRFLGTHAGRKALYADALVEAGAPERVPPPLVKLLDYLAAQRRATSIST